MKNHESRKFQQAARRSRTALLALLVLLVACLCWRVPTAGTAQGIVNTKHNLSVTGPGEVRALSEERICVFCHTPHAARDVAPLWNRQDPVAVYQPYDSPTLKAQPGQPTGASKLCLSCHDGAIALGDLVSEQIPVGSPSGGRMPPGRSLIGTDLRDDHPVSIGYQASFSLAGGLLAPMQSWDPRVKLDANNDLQCTTCHDPHSDQWGQFLVMGNENSELCRQCHTFPMFDMTPHALSQNQWNGSGLDPWPHTNYATVAANACLNCHRTHHAPSREELLSSPAEEEVCFVCHNGNVATLDLAAVFRKAYIHPVQQTQGVHVPGESPLASAGHVECSDCHNPHRARAESASAPFVKGTLRGVTGVDIAGSPLAEAMNEYEICFKCHGDAGERPVNAITRVIPSLNTRREFSPSSPSYHPVATPGVSPNVPSLRDPLSAASVIYCTDCHGNDGAEGVTGPAGPHGSNFEFLLRRQYTTGDDVQESPQAYDLCYGCHLRESILANESYSGHNLHVVGQRAPCSVCHDPHGIDFGEGDSVRNAHLMNFDTSVVQADTVTLRLEYRSLGPGTGECYLRCHGVDHSPRRYPIP